MLLQWGLIVLALLSLSVIANPACPAIDTVFTIILENEDAKSVLSDAYFGTTLARQGYLLKNMNGVAHPSQPNYVALVAGATKGVTNDNNVNLSGQIITDLITAKGLKWRAYMEDYPGNCFTSAFNNGDNYARKHNPFISFYYNNAAQCANIVPATQLDVDVAGGNLANYVFYTPNQQNDGHDTDVPTASKWLQGFLNPKLTDPAYAKTLFIVTFDESATSSPNQIYTVLLGAGIIGKGQTDTALYNHYSTLATIEKVFAVGNLGQGDVSATVFPLNCAVVGVTSSTTSTTSSTTTSSSSSSTSTSKVISTSSVVSASTTSTSTVLSTSSIASVATTTSSSTTSTTVQQPPTSSVSSSSTCTRTVFVRRGGAGGGVPSSSAPSSSSAVSFTTTIVSC